MTTTTRAAKLAAAVLVLVAVPLAACGADDRSDDAVASLDGAAAASDSGGGSGNDNEDGGGGLGGRARLGDDPEFQDAMLEYAQCMREHGIDMPDPTFDDDGRVILKAPGPNGPGTRPTDDAFMAADDACRSILEDAAPDISLSPEEQAEMQDKMLAMAECMRAKGHDMPDPQVSDKGTMQVHVGDGNGGGPDLDDPDFQDDMEECADEAGMEPPMSGGRVGGGPGGNSEGSG
jgi:hypothetical protein